MMAKLGVTFEIEFFEGDPLEFDIPPDDVPNWQRALEKGKEAGRGVIKFYLAPGVVLTMDISNIKDWYPDG